jgi:LysM repeat protein
VKRIVQEILIARRHEDQPGEGGRKTVGKRSSVQYVSRVRKEAVYRRRRIGALFVAAVLAFGLYAGSGAGAEAPSVVYTVSSGDTLWSVATDHYSPSEDPRVAVEAILEANDLSGAQIYPGMRLELPATG